MRASPRAVPLPSARRRGIEGPACVLRGIVLPGEPPAGEKGLPSIYGMRSRNRWSSDSKSCRTARPGTTICQTLRRRCGGFRSDSGTASRCASCSSAGRGRIVDGPAVAHLDPAAGARLARLAADLGLSGVLHGGVRQETGLCVRPSGAVLRDDVRCMVGHGARRHRSGSGHAAGRRRRPGRVDRRDRRGRLDRPLDIGRSRGLDDRVDRRGGAKELPSQEPAPRRVITQP